MNRTISTSLSIALACTAGAGAAFAATDTATDNSQTITIRARHPTGERAPTTGAPIEVVRFSRGVDYSDLNLRTSAGAAILEKRVSDTATELCRRIDVVYPLSADETSNVRKNCVEDATDDAMIQVREAIAAAGGNVTNGAS